MAYICDSLGIACIMNDQIASIVEHRSPGYDSQ